MHFYNKLAHFWNNFPLFFLCLNCPTNLINYLKSQYSKDDLKSFTEKEILRPSYLKTSLFQSYFDLLCVQRDELGKAAVFMKTISCFITVIICFKILFFLNNYL